MKAIVVVAHPDDCIIFAYSFMLAYPELDWSICYLTYTNRDPRGHELQEFWHKRNIPTMFLGYVDDWHDIENKQISFDEAHAWIDIQEAISGQDIVVTHDAEGDYGHLHHVFVHNAVLDYHPGAVIFSKIGKGNARYTVPLGTYALDELPEHGSIIASFHSKEHANEYFIPDSVKELLNKS
jgi:LmbE family N-acetylglucosaminyl deacetylase